MKKNADIVQAFLIGCSFHIEGTQLCPKHLLFSYEHKLRKTINLKTTDDINHF